MSLRGRLKKITSLRNTWRSMFRGEDNELTPGARDILIDLQRFCHATRSTIKVSPTTGVIDPLAMAVAEGRREVFMRIAPVLHFAG